MNGRTKAHLALLAANLIYGANFSIAKIAMPGYIQPLGFILLRVTFAFSLFYLFSKISGAGKVTNKNDHLRLFCCGLFGVALNQMLFFEGLSRTSNINAALMMTTSPILVMAGASIIHKERLSISRLAGIGFGVAGAVSLILMRKDVHGTANWLGDLMVFINAASYAVFMIIAKPLMKKYSPWLVIRWTFFYGLLFVVPFGYGQASIIEWHTFTPSVWMATLYVIIGTTFFAYWFNTFGLQHLSAAVVSFYIYLQPVFATLVSLLITHERVSVQQIIACVLIFTGVFLVNRPVRSTN